MKVEQATQVALNAMQFVLALVQIDEWMEGWMDGCWVCGKVDGKITDIVIKLLEEFLTQLVRLLSFRRYGRSQRFFEYERTCCVRGHLVDRAIMTSAVGEKINCERTYQF